MNVTGFPHQVGGHFGLLTCGGHVCKPLSLREFTFYSQMDSKLHSFVPNFCGRMRVNLQNAENGLLSMSADVPLHCHIETERSKTSEMEPIQPMLFRLRNSRVEAEQVFNMWAGQCQSKVVQKLVNGHDRWFIVLEDVTAKFVRPCVVDLKMGTRQCGDDAPPQKRLSQKQKCRQSTSEGMGVRMVGLQLFDRENRKFLFVNKYEGRKMTPIQLHDSLDAFLKTAGTERAKAIIERLRDLRSFMATANGFRFFSSSLLIAFDGVGDSSDVVVRMIDFAHSTFNGFMEDRIYTGTDDGYILGLDSLVALCTDILSTLNSTSARQIGIPFPSCPAETTSDSDSLLSDLPQ